MIIFTCKDLRFWLMLLFYYHDLHLLLINLQILEYVYQASNSIFADFTEYKSVLVSADNENLLFVVL